MVASWLARPNAFHGALKWRTHELRNTIKVQNALNTRLLSGETFSTGEHHVYMIVSNDVFQIPQLSLNLMGAVFRSAEISARKRSSYCGLVFLLVCLFACFFFSKRADDSIGVTFTFSETFWHVMSIFTLCLFYLRLACGVCPFICPSYKNESINTP